MKPTRCVSALLLAAFGLAAWADVYISSASDGALALTNVPADPGYRLFLRDPALDDAAPSARQAAARGQAFQRLVEQASHESGLAPALLHAIVSVESGYDPRAVSRAGAMGLMQLMPKTARDWGVADPFDPRQNLRGGARHLKRLLQAFDGDLRLSLAAYNAGEAAVRRHGNRVPCNAETPRYVVAVLDRYQRAAHRAVPPTRMACGRAAPPRSPA